MRYWLLSNDEPSGPYTAEDLDGIAGFSRSSLVYPEKRLDPRDERWMQAGDMPQLAAALAGVERRAFAGRYIVPEPTVRDLPVLGSILKQLERFEEELIEYRENLIARHQELTQLRGETDAGARHIRGVGGEVHELEKRIERIEPLQADILHLREAGLEAAQAAQRTEDKILAGVEELRRRLGTLENDIDAEAQQEMMRGYTASLQERIAGLGMDLKREGERAEAMRRELSGLRDTHAQDRAGRGLLAGGKLFRVPEAVVFLLFALLAAAVSFLFYVRPATPVPAAAPAAAITPEAPPTPIPPVIIEPPSEPKAKKPAVRRSRKSSVKRAEELAREKEVRDLILLRVTGGVPSSKKPVSPSETPEN